MQQGLLMKGNRLVIPVSMRLDVLDKLHEGHQGITKCRERAKTSVWWPGLSKQLEELVNNCSTCIKERVNRPEPVIPSELPDRPRQKLAADLFELKGQTFLLVVDYFSRYVEVAKLTRTTSPDIVVHLKSMFARHGIPDQLVSDNGPQFSSNAFAQFAEEYAFTHITTSPRYSQANGEVERAVQTVKHLLKKAQDPYRALLAYRATPLESGLCPAELLMGRKIRTQVPTVPAQLIPSWHYLEQFREKDASLKARQKKNFDKRHFAKNVSDLSPGERVWLPDRRVEGTVLDKVGTPRSYAVETPNGELRRNRRHLNPLPDPPEAGNQRDSAVPDQALPSIKINSPMHTPTSTTPRRTTRSGREIRLPERFKD